MPSLKTQLESGTHLEDTALPVKAPSSPAPLRHGILSRLRSYFIFDPLIWMYTVVLGLTSVPASLFGDKERVLHNFSR